MIHARYDYQRIQDPAGKIPVDEHVFLLRGQDRVAPLIVKLWAIANFMCGGTYNMSKIAWRHANKMKAYQKRTGRKKTADLADACLKG